MCLPSAALSRRWFTMSAKLQTKVFLTENSNVGNRVIKELMSITSANVSFIKPVLHEVFSLSFAFKIIVSTLQYTFLISPYQRSLFDKRDYCMYDLKICMPTIVSSYFSSWELPFSWQYRFWDESVCPGLPYNIIIENIKWIFILHIFWKMFNNLSHPLFFLWYFNCL